MVSLIWVAQRCSWLFFAVSKCTKYSVDICVFFTFFPWLGVHSLVLWELVSSWPASFEYWLFGRLDTCAAPTCASSQQFRAKGEQEAPWRLWHWCRFRNVYNYYELYIYKCHIYFVYFCIYIYIQYMHMYIYIYIHTRADWSGVMAWVSTLKALLMQHRAFAAEAGFAGRCFHHVQPYRLLRLEPTAKNRQLHLYNDFFGKLQKVWKGRLMPWTEQLVWLPAKCITIHCILPSFFGLTNT